MKNRMIALLLASFIATPALATELTLRNIRLVDTGHITNIAGTVVNNTDHPVAGGYLDIEVRKNEHVIARETVEVPDMEAGQAWRIWQPVQYDGAKPAAKVSARDADVSVSASVVPYPGTVVAQ